MCIKKILLLLTFCLLNFELIAGQELREEFQKTGYVEIPSPYPADTFCALYASFDELIAFLQANPTWAQKLYVAKERFIRTKERNYYCTDFFGFIDESKRQVRKQITFYYSVHFHEFITEHYPEFYSIAELNNFLNLCNQIQKPCGGIFHEATTTLGVNSIFASNNNQPPILLKVVKYLSSHADKQPHYDGTALSIFLDSTDNSALLLSPYKPSYTTEDFFSPARENSILLIPGILLTEFSIYPTPHIVIKNNKSRYSAIAFAMRPHYTYQKTELFPLPFFKD